MTPFKYSQYWAQVRDLAHAQYDALKQSVADPIGRFGRYTKTPEELAQGRRLRFYESIGRVIGYVIRGLLFLMFLPAYAIIGVFVFFQVAALALLGGLFVLIMGLVAYVFIRLIGAIL